MIVYAVPISIKLNFVSLNSKEIAKTVPIKRISRVFRNCVTLIARIPHPRKGWYYLNLITQYNTTDVMLNERGGRYIGVMVLVGH